MDAVIIAVAHEEFLSLKESDIAALYSDGTSKVLLDIKGLLDRDTYEKAGYCYWRL